MSAKIKVLAVALMLVYQSVATLQSTMTKNYSTDVLRIAKASHIKAYLNQDANPCTNFYKFACGNWKKLNAATKKTGKTSNLLELEDLYIRKCPEMLKSRSAVDTNVDIMLKDFYASCHDEESLKKLGLDPIIKAVDFKGGWPKITRDSWYEDEYDWMKIVADLRRKLGLNILVGMEVIPDLEDINTHRIMVGAPKLALGFRDVYLNAKYENTRATYRQNIVEKLRRFFTDMPHQWAEEVAHQVLALEQQLAKGLADNKELTLKQISRLRSVADLKAAYGNYVDLSRYLNYIFNQTIYVQVYESPVDYMSNLLEVIKQTPKLTIANYTMWRVLEHLDFAGEVNSERNDRWCVHKTIEFFAKPLESMFHRNYNNMQMINELQSVWADIKKTFREQLQSSTKLNWITQDTRQKALLKVDAIELEFILHDYENFAEQLRGLSFKKEHYYQNLINALQWQTQHNLARLVEQPQDDDIEEVKLPKYVLAKNKILIPITFLQAYFFWDAAYPTALKYSTFGYFLAQEMLRGFDNIGHKYDHHGYQRTWWDTVSEYAFMERAKCFAKQYGNYKFQGKSLTDLQTPSTSIADNGAISIAYQTYQKWSQNVANSEPADNMETLPLLLKYSPNQLFFIGFAQVWCADYHESIDKFTEVPESLRVIGALSNSLEFSKEYKCDMGSEMNPDKKCSIY